MAIVGVFLIGASVSLYFMFDHSKARKKKFENDFNRRKHQKAEGRK